MNKESDLTSEMRTKIVQNMEFLTFLSRNEQSFVMDKLDDLDVANTEMEIYSKLLRE